MPASAPIELLTVGYEGEDLERFVAKLQAAGVERLVDVRYTPLSRKRGFSKTPLSERLKAAGIEYVHYKELGTLKVYREEYKRTGDWETFAGQYDRYLDDQMKAMQVLYQLCGTRRSALLCFEAEACHCHRSVLARRLATDFDGPHRLVVTHLAPAGSDQAAR